MADLETRLYYIVQAIDAGQIRTPERAVQAILDVMGSCTPEHRNQLSNWFFSLPEVKVANVQR